MPAIARAQPGCAPLPAPSGIVVDVTPSQVASLQSILDAAQPGHTIQLADGVYSLPQTLVLRRDGVTLRSKSGNRLGVVLDGRYAIGNVLLLQKSNITIADLTLTRSYWHLVHVTADGGSSSGALLHNIRAVDGAEQFVKVNPANGQYADNGVLRCSLLEMTDTGRTFVRNNCYTGGVDIHQARGWQIYANVLGGFWCASGLSEHAIHAWTGSRDTLVDRNVIINSARGIGFGLGSSVIGRTYGDGACGGATYVGHFGGSITNNFVVANDPRLFASAEGFDTGIGLEQSCETNVLHNTVVSTAVPRSSSIEWRFANTVAVVANNLVTHSLLPRDGARATLAGNIANAALSSFVDVANANVHLLPAATTAIDKAVPLANPLLLDIDAERRSSAADVGADEYHAAAPTFGLSASATAVAAGTIEVTWTASPGGASASDWIGLYAVGAADSASLDRKYTAGQSTGTVFFSAPGTPGTYETRYFSGTGAIRVAVSNPIVVPPTSSSATFVRADLTTQGTWRGAYGGDGYAIVGDGTRLPAYAQLTVAGAATWTWAAATTEARALQRETSGRVAATWYASAQFALDVKLTDSAPHQVAVYVVDWDGGASRAERVDVVDATTGAVLDSRGVSHFSGGQYLVWTVTGHVRIQVVRTGAINTVVSAVFFGPAGASTPPPPPPPLSTSPSATFVRADLTTQGTWRGAYGGDGYALVGDATRLPAYAQLTPTGAATWTWAAATTEARALQRETSGRVAATWYASTQFALDVKLTDGAPHQVAVYVVDWDGGNGRAERVDVVDATTGAVLDSRVVSHFSGGQYLVWTVTGHVRIQVARTGAINAVVSAVFFGPAGGSPPPPTSASFVRADATTQGTWRGAYGGDGYSLVGDGTRLPAYAQLTPTGAATWTWAAATTDGRALQRETSGRVAATWYASTQFAIDVNLTDGAAHQVALYVVDWDGGSTRAERVEIVDATTGAVLDSRVVSHFSGGQYLVWTVTGHVRIQVVRTGATNAVVSAVFFGAAGGSTP